jgi:hypothetical protein
MFMNEYLLQLKKEFGKYGSWALWDEDGGIENIIKDKKFISLIKPNIIFMGLNASRDLRGDIDWVNFHFLKTRKNSSWRREHCRKLANVLSELEFSCFSGSYMTDIIKTKYDSNCANLMDAIKKDERIIAINEELLKEEMKLLSRISGSDKFIIICNGKKTYDILKTFDNQIFKHEVYKIWHYSAYQLGWEGVKEQIRQDLRQIMKRLQII